MVKSLYFAADADVEPWRAERLGTEELTMRISKRTSALIAAALGSLFIAATAHATPVTEPLPAPTVVAATPAFPGHSADLAFDGRPNTEYSSFGGGADTYLDFDFGRSTRINHVIFTDRHAANENVTAFDLIFSNDPGFALRTVMHVSSPNPGDTLDVSIRGNAGISARYVRFDVTASQGINVGASEFVFLSPVPEPASASSLVLGCGAAVLRRRRSA